MAEAQSQVLASQSLPHATAARRTKRWFYIVLAVLMTILIGWGFWPSYYGPLVRGAAQTPAILHVHGVIFAGWMALLIVQVTLAAQGRVRAHRALGKVGIGYGTLVFLMGLLVSFVAPVMHVRRGEWTIDDAAAFSLIPLMDMVLFGAFFAAAVANRHRAETHKRLMLVATISILFAAAFRLNAAGMPMVPALALWFAPLVGAMAYDAWTRRHVHGVYWIGLVVLALSLLRLPWRTTDIWLGITRPIFATLV
jgi:hypothetical protein